jgi:hypothetical protein
MSLNCNVEITRDFFLELNAKHVHGGKNKGIKDCVSDVLLACTCLPNTYTSRTHLVHVFVYLFVKIVFVACFVNLKGVMTRVCVVYMLDKHVHALNLLIISMITCVFEGRVRVWRLILKKITMATRKLKFITQRRGDAEFF